MFYQKTIKKLKSEIETHKLAYEDLRVHHRRQTERYLYEISEAKKVQVKEVKHYNIDAGALAAEIKARYPAKVSCGGGKCGKKHMVDASYINTIILTATDNYNNHANKDSTGN
jgi:hypothetical protein